MAEQALGGSLRVMREMVGARTLIEIGSWLTSALMPFPYRIMGTGYATGLR